MRKLTLGVVLATFTGAAAAGDLADPRSYESSDRPQLLFQARFGEQGINQLALNGVDLRGAMLSSSQAAGGGFFSSMTATQWLALGFTLVVFGTVAAEAGDSPSEPSGTGGS